MAAQHGHGHTPAAWTGVIIAFTGFCVAGGFMIAAEPVGFWVGIGLVLLGAAVGGVMSMLGMGQDSKPVLTSSDRDDQRQAGVHSNA